LSGLTQSLATIPALNGGVPYYFTVEATNRFGAGPASAEKSAVPLNTYEAWRNLVFTPAQIAAGQAADSADPDGDGVSNLREYAFGLDPMQVSVTSAAALRFTGSPVQLSVILPLWADKDDITLTVEASTNLTAWTSLARSIGGGPMTALVGGVTVNTSGANPAVVTVTDTPAEAAALQRFLWVRVTRP
jgi:hypothetical protein